MRLKDEDLRFARSRPHWGQYENADFVVTLIDEVLRLRRASGELECRNCWRPMSDHPRVYRGGSRLLRHNFEDDWRGAPLVSA